MNRAVFLDRDGVITEDPPHYAHRVDQIKLIPGTPEAIKLLNDTRFLVIVVSNQSGIARGYYPEQDTIRFNYALNEMLGGFGAHLDDIFYCPHHPDAKCDCRKPKPKMLLDAKRMYDIDMENSFLIGDKSSDIIAGKRAGCKTILVKTGHGLEELENRIGCDYIIDDLYSAVQYILALNKKVRQEHQEDELILTQKDGKYYVNGYEVMDGLNNLGWWDGPVRYKKVNRNIISWVQHDLLFSLVRKLTGKIGVDIGGPTGKGIDGIINVNISFAYITPNCVLGRGENLPFKNGSIDYLISAHSLEHIRNTELVLKEWVRVLRPGGMMAVVMPDKRYHLHDPTVTREGEAAYSEMEPVELLSILKKISGIELISFNSQDNNFDFECVLRKRMQDS